MKIDKKQILLIFVILVMIGIFFFMQYVPTMEALQQAKNQQTQKEIQQAHAQSQLQNLPELRNQLNQLKDEVGNIDTRIPDRPQLGDFLQNVSSIMDKYSLSQQMVKPSQEQKIGDFASIPVDIQCSGNLNQIFDFFRDIEQNQRLFRLEQVRFENKDFSGNIRIFAKGSIFYKQGI